MLFDETTFERFDLNSLITFLVVYRDGGVTKAARALKVTQPAVSNVLSKLRHRFKDPLFHYRGAVLEPTPKAIEIAKTLEPAFNQIQGLLKEVNR